MLRCAEGPLRHLAPLRATSAGAALAGLMAGCSAPVMLERSFRLSAAGLAGDRFLLSVAATAAPDGLLPALVALGLPAAALESARAALPGAAKLHLGLQAEPERGPVLKLYLERPDGFAPDGSAGPPLHRAWKWRPATGEVAMDRYMLVPPHQARERLMLVPAPLQTGLWAALAALAAKPGWLFMLDVLGAGARRSLDIRCYDFNRSIGDLAGPIASLAEALGCATATLAEHHGERLGHLAFGLEGDGGLFVTVYAGGEQCDAAMLA